jgi:hypothetical protein
MNGFHELVDRWGALASGIVLLALPSARWLYGAPLSWVDILVGGVGVAALLLALEDSLRRRALARAIRRKPASVACPRCGEPLAEAA